MLVSGVGFVFFNYGRKKSRPIFLIVGLFMMIYPYFITNFFYMIGIGVVLSVLLYWLGKMGY